MCFHETWLEISKAFFNDLSKKVEQKQNKNLDGYIPMVGFY